MITIDPEFRKNVKDVMEHLYDTAYLETHPLISKISLSDSASRVTRAQKLRSLVKDLIETLRPQQGSPASSPEWRCYRALRFRYVQGMNIGQVESELGISERQLQREFHKGLDAISALLWEQRRASENQAPSPKIAGTDEIEDLQTELGQWTLQRHAYEVDVLIDDMAWTIKPMMASQNIQLNLAIQPNSPQIIVDGTLTRQALLKLVRLIMRGNPTEITLSTQAVDKNIEVRLRCSNPVEYNDDADWKIAQLLFEQQGGKLVSANTSDQTLMIISLPRLDQLSVLVVDDNPALHQLFERYLTLNQYTVIHAYSGPEALKLATEKSPNFITLDVMMASMDGWQVLRGLQNNPQTAAIPVIVCSVLKEPELALSLGARAYLKKPIERLQLQETLERLRLPGT